MKNMLIPKVAEELKSAPDKATFDRILNYHFKNKTNDFKKELENYGVDFKKFDKKEKSIKKEIVKNDIAAASEVDVKSLTKMVIDKPIVKQK